MTTIISVTNIVIVVIIVALLVTRLPLVVEEHCHSVAAVRSALLLRTHVQFGGARIESPSLSLGSPPTLVPVALTPS